jgi:hypothetical protein
MSAGVVYKKGYKYQLKQLFMFQTGITGSASGSNYWCGLSANGVLTANDGYAWDGVTSAFDTKASLRASLVHDVLYQLIREGKLPSSMKKDADEEFYRICVQDGVWSVRAKYMWLAVRLFGKFALKHDSRTLTL